ncbi:putative nuclease SbcCD D subunit [Klebsiella phage vB_KpM_FBKp24]|uniref:Putative nuclease SbcCD D subunit n=1 Tax=Klebsiella phage vB_KpM_FBKp24 TaxID=2801834 RepID=A0A7U0GBC0_9CAUD|nr:hypothetical protein [Klebsiella pneumoniae]YP_010298715.1 putative nuclease SbcCD D subunit [Klebsiella phage vB_KpM_FBKp24]QQV92071.1 putative nuclease SbcCD D subunit [Klebsiella phage vB_KpM_FBKp24]
MITDKKLTIGAISDIHFFHKRTKSPRMLADIRRLYPMEEKPELDILTVSGDYFDHLVSFNDPDIYYAMEGARHLLRYCKKWDILLRVLEGTNLHDRKQSQIFDFINTGEGIECKLKYIDALSIEYLEEWDINILYLPDEWTHNAELTYQQVKDLIHSRGMEKVDIAIVHGGCSYQLPGIHSPALHDAAKWSDLVSLAILSGHIHNHSRFMKWISVGSLNRLGHGEEEPKGVLEITFLNGKEINFKRKINTKAKIYRTISAIGLDFPEIIDLIDQQTDLVEGSALRIEFMADDPVLPWMEILKSTFPALELSEIRRGKKTATTTGSTFTQKRYEFTALTPSSVSPLFKQRWENEQIPSEKIDHALRLLQDLIEE